MNPPILEPAGLGAPPSLLGIPPQTYGFEIYLASGAGLLPGLEGMALGGPVGAALLSEEQLG